MKINLFYVGNNLAKIRKWFMGQVKWVNRLTLTANWLTPYKNENHNSKKETLKQ